MATDRIKGITIEINGDTTDLQKALKSVNTEIRSSQSQLRDLDKLLKFDPGNTELLKQKYNALGSEIDATKQKLNTLKEAESQMKSAGATDTAEWDNLQREIAATEQDLKGLTKEMRNFGSVALQELDAAGKKMQNVGQKITDAGSKVAGFGAKVTAGVTVPLVAMGTKAASSFAEVDKTMQLTNKTMGNTEEEAEQLNKAMKEAAANSIYGMSDAATATLNFARAGLDAKQASAALAPAMNLAAGEGGNLDTVSAGLVATINGFHGAFEDAGTYADIFAAACNNSALDIDSLSNAMSVAAPIFSSAGYTVQDAALYMGVMANNGIDADKAANSLKTGLARLVAPAEQGADMMEKLGINVTNADGSMKDSITIQRELHDTFAKLSESEQLAAASAIFGKNQMAPWLALINSAPADVESLNNSLSTCKGTTDEMANAMMSGFGGSLEKLKSSVDVAVTSLGEALAPTILKIAECIQGLVDKFNSLSPAQQEMIAKIGMIVAAVGPAITILGSLMSSVGSIITVGGKLLSGISKLGTVLKGLWAILTANPITLIVAAVAALVAAFIYLWNNCEGFRDFWINLWEKIKEIVSKAVENIKKFFSGIVDFVKNNWDGLLTLIVNPFAGAFKLLYDNCDKFREFVDNFIAKVKEGFTNAWNNIKEGVSNAWNGIKTTVSNVINGIKTTISNGLNVAKNTVFNVLNGIKNKFTSIWDGVKNIVSGAIEKIKSFLNFKWELPKIKLPHFSISGKFSLDPPSIPHISVDWYKKAMADGMILNQPTIFGASGGKLLGAGEAGPEAVVGASSLRSMIQESVSAQFAGLANALGGDTYVYIGNEQIEAIIQKANQRMNLRSGGR